MSDESDLKRLWPLQGPGDTTKKHKSDVADKTEAILTDDEYLSTAITFLSADVMGKLDSPIWSARRQGLEGVTARVEGTGREDIPCQVCVRAACCRPGLADPNIHVLRDRVKLISKLAQKAVFTETSATFCLTDLVSCLHEFRLHTVAQEALCHIAAATSLEYVSDKVMKAAFSQNQVKIQCEALKWFANALVQLGMNIQVEQHIEYLKTALYSTKGDVRAAAMTAVTVLYMFVGPPLREYFQGERTSLIQQLDKEFKKVEGKQPHVPTKDDDSS